MLIYWYWIYDKHTFIAKGKPEVSGEELFETQSQQEDAEQGKRIVLTGFL